MNPETTTLANWLLACLATGVMAVLGFLVKKAFNDTTTAVTALSAKLDVITAAQARADGDVRELKAELRSELSALRERVSKIEAVQREIV